MKTPALLAAFASVGLLCVACGGSDEESSEQFGGAGGGGLVQGGSAGQAGQGGQGGTSSPDGGTGGGSSGTGGTTASGGTGASAGQGGTGTGGTGGFDGPRCGGTCDSDNPDVKFNPCTCDPSDPCDWQDDGVCQRECTDWGVVTESFDDEKDCATCNINDDNEPNDDISDATEVGGDGIITDCEGWRGATGAIKTTDDEDWYAYQGKDAPCGIDHIAPHVELKDSTQGLEVCVFAKPHEPGPEPTCSLGTASSEAAGYFGCCATDKARLDLPNEFGKEDNAEVRMLVRSDGTAACVLYEITFGYGWL